MEEPRIHVGTVVFLLCAHHVRIRGARKGAQPGISSHSWELHWALFCLLPLGPTVALPTVGEETKADEGHSFRLFPVTLV